MTIRLSTVRDVSMSRPGLWQEFTAVGKVQGDLLEISREDFDVLQAKWFPGIAIGSIVHEVLKPVVQVVDRVAGTNLAHCGGCAERQMRLNSLTSSGQ